MIAEKKNCDVKEAFALESCPPSEAIQTVDTENIAKLVRPNPEMDDMPSLVKLPKCMRSDRLKRAQPAASQWHLHLL